MYAKQKITHEGYQRIGAIQGLLKLVTSIVD